MAGQDGVGILDVLVERRAHDVVGLEGGVGVAPCLAETRSRCGSSAESTRLTNMLVTGVTRARPLPAPSRSFSPAR